MSGRGVFTFFRLGLLAVFTACLLLSASSAAWAARSGFQADLLYAESGKEARKGGSAMTSGEQARLDVRLGKAGDFVLLVDGEARRMRVLSQKLKGYVETSIEGDAHNWRDLLTSASSMLVPQTLGMVSLTERSREELGREKLEGHDAIKSRHVFTLGFLGSYRDISVIVWESAVSAPFPIKAEVLEDSRTRGGAVWLGGIRPVPGAEEAFSVPEGFTRFTSVLDLILYALSEF